MINDNDELIIIDTEKMCPVLRCRDLLFRKYILANQENKPNPPKNAWI